MKHTREDTKITRIFYGGERGSTSVCSRLVRVCDCPPNQLAKRRPCGKVYRVRVIFSWASVIVFGDFLMADLKEQIACIKFCFLLGKTAAETVTMLREAFKEEALNQAKANEWLSRFKRGDMSLEDQPRSGRPSTSRTDENIQKNFAMR